MASRKEDKERLRAQREAAEAAERGQARRRELLGYGAAGILAALVVVGIVVAIAKSGGGGSSSSGGGDCGPNAHLDVSVGSQNNVACDNRKGTPPPPVKQANLQKAAKAAGCKLTLNLPDYGRQHVPPATKVSYKGEPPTSGNHVEPPFQQADGAYSEEPLPIDFVHSMEHQRVEFEYAPDLADQDQLAIKGVFDQSPSGILLFPNDQLTDQVAAAAWRNRMNCAKYEGTKTLVALADFRDAFRGSAGEGPEPGFPITP